ncbi:rod shape-determining protein MreC [Spirochaetia bacterium 38H-sp]|uniref:Cell shape-determining protein MreC n=1 Tax=Rarispira pelagica TaxID=3141764 RepID=A0ABU9UCP0_9SPIR
MIEKVNNMQEKIINYEEKITKYNVILEENKRLKNNLGILQSIEFSVEYASVISNDLLSADISFLIDKGERNNIHKNNPVIVVIKGKPVILGKVMEVYDDTARVMTIFNKQFYIPAKIMGSNNIGLINGMGSNHNYLSMSYIPYAYKNDIKIGDIVVSSSLSLIFPEGLKIGVVKEIVANDYDSSLKLYIEPYATIGQIEDVFIITKSVKKDEREE